MQNLYSKLKKEEGSGLILALMTLMVLAVLGASLGAITVGSFRLSNVNRDSTSAYYIAEAGANQAYEEIKGHVYVAHENTSSQGSFFDQVNELSKDYADGLSIAGFSDQFGGSPESFVTLDKVETNDRTVSYKLTSRGTVDGKERIVEKDFTVTWVEDSTNTQTPPLPSGAAVIAEKSINSRPNADTDGGEVIGPDNWKDYLNLVDAFPDPSKFDKEVVPSLINAEQDSIQNFKVDELDLSKVSVEGDGIVNIYIKNTLLFEGDSFNLGRKPENMRIYYAGSDELILNKDYEFNGSLFIKNADITLRNKVKFSGTLLSGGDNVFFGVQGNNNEVFETYIIAPKADIHIRNHVTINGTVIGRKVQLDNQSMVSYNEKFKHNFSFNLTDSEENNEIIISKPIIEAK